MKKTTKFLTNKMNSINYITIQTLVTFQNSKKSSNALQNFIWVSPDFEAHKISFKNTENLPEFLIENLVLDCNSGRIGFGSETDWYGWCFDSLKGLNLYPGKVNNRFQFEAIGITILDFKFSLYGLKYQISFISLIRRELKFSTFTVLNLLRAISCVYADTTIEINYINSMYSPPSLKVSIPLTSQTVSKRNGLFSENRPFVNWINLFRAKRYQRYETIYLI